MLFAHLQRHAQCAVAQPVDRHADDATREVAFECVAGGHVACARAAEAHRCAEALGRPDGDVGTPFARGLQQREGQQVGDGRDHGSFGVSGCGERSVIAYGTVGRRILHDSPELLARELVLVVVVDNQFDAIGLAAGQQHVERLREDVAVDKQLVTALLDCLARTAVEHHQHRLGGSGALVQQRAVADFHAGQRDDGGLEVEQGFQSSL